MTPSAVGENTRSANGMSRREQGALASPSRRGSSKSSFSAAGPSISPSHGTEGLTREAATSPTMPGRSMDDPATLEAVRHIVRTQFDYEILLKQRELSNIRSQIAKGEDLLHYLHYLIINGTSAAPSRSTSPIHAHQTRFSTRPSRTTSSQHKLPNPTADVLYSRRDDGVYVRLACPACHRWEFANMQGFLNHCRIKHQMEFPSHTEAARSCGTPVDESEIPPNHAARRIPIKVAAFEKPTNFVWGIAPTESPSGEEESAIPAPPVPVPKERPKIKVYEEDVDMMDVDQPIEPPSTLHLVPLEDDTVDVTEPTSLTMPGMSVSNMSMDSPNPTRISDQKLSSETAPGAKDELNFGAVLMELSVPVPSDSSNHRGVESEQNAISDLKGAEYDYIKSEGMATKDENEIAQFEADLTRAQNSASGPADPNAPEVVRSFSAVGTADEGSRFYVKRRVLLGNVSKYLSVEKRDAGLEKYAYKWMIYLQGPPTSEDMTSFVRKVRFYLHPDYRPFDVVEVTEPPFRLTRYGWGEFPVRLQLYFVDERNKPVDIIHIVKLDKSKCGRQLPGSERFIDLELDRNTEFAEPRLFIKPPEPELDSHAERKSDMETDVARAAMAAAAAKRDALDRLLPKIVKQHPIIQASNAKPASVPYTVATSEASYRSWPMGKKKATELRRARLVLQCLRALPDMKHDVSLKDVVSWCVNNGYTPAGQAKSGNGEANAATTGEPTKRRDAYCRICGAFNAHDGDSEECDKRPPMWRGRVWSLSQANGILEKAGIGGIENLDDVSDADDINVDTMRDSTLVGQPGSAPSAYPWCAQEHSTVTDQQLEWVNRVVKQLRLPSSLEENAAGKQVTTGLIFETTKVFIRHLLRKTIDVYQQDQAADQPATPPTTDTEDTADPTAVAAEASQKVARPRLLVPYHLYRGIVESQDENSEFDFLTGAGLALGNLPEPSQEP